MDLPNQIYYLFISDLIKERVRESDIDQEIVYPKLELQHQAMHVSLVRRLLEMFRQMDIEYTIYIDIGTICLHVVISVRSFSSRKGDRVKGWIRGIVILASCKHHFIRVQINLMQHSNMIYPF